MLPGEGQTGGAVLLECVLPPMPSSWCVDAAGVRRLRARLQSGKPAPGNFAEEPPLRADLLSRDQMEEHGKRLAASHRVEVRRAADSLLARLADNEAALIHACGLLTDALEATRRIAPAGEWLLDNFYL